MTGRCTVPHPLPLHAPGRYVRIRRLPLPSPPTADATRADVALLDRITAQDPAALGELYDRHSRLIFGLVLRMLRNQDEAEEAVDQRDLIQQAYFLGFTHSELAERYRLPLGTVKTRIRSGMQTLRRHLDGRYIEQ